MSLEQQQLEAAIAALETQRAVLGDAVVESLMAPARLRLAALMEAPGELASAGTAPSLKQVSILFVDVVGSTALSGRLDPEATAAVMDSALSQGTAVVQVHGGKVLQYAGDSILAVFGADEAREDDAERAVRCGLALLELGCSMGADVQARHGHGGFNVRVGVHTGDVLVGGAVGAQGNIRGLAVNIAARMEQTAPVGGLRISHDTHAQVRGLFEVELQPLLSVKGIEAPIQSYLVKSAKPRSFRRRQRGIGGLTTRMVGRDTEFGLLQTAFQRLFTERQFAAVMVVAEAGIGKSRLLEEFEGWTEAQPQSFLCLRGRATLQTATQAYGLLRDLIADCFHIRDDDTLEVAHAKLDAALVPLFVHDDGPDLAQSHAHLLGHLIGFRRRDSPHVKGILDDPRQIRNRAFHAAAQLLRRMAAAHGAPILLHLDDLHWADGESLDFLSHLAKVNHDVPLLMLGLARPTLFEQHPNWGGADGTHQRIDLAPLGPLSSSELAGELLKKLAQVPPPLVDVLTGRAEGNPFYMEELLKTLIDQGAIQTGDTWHADAERLRSTQVPATLTGLLQARLDGLPAPEKRALQQASIVGMVFWDEALAAVEPRAVKQLPALVERNLTLPRAEMAVNGMQAYAFNHHLLHQVTYATVLRRDKREGHACVAEWLAALSAQDGRRADDFLGAAAEHFESAGEDARAVEFHARAAENAVQSFAQERTLAHVSRALALLGPQQAGATVAQAELRWRLLKARARALERLARRDEQVADLDALDALAERLNDDHRRTWIAIERGALALRTADWASQEGAARRAIGWAEKTGDHGQRLNALRLLAWAILARGDTEGGRSLALQGIAEARERGLRDVEARLLNVISLAADAQGDLLGRMDSDQQSLRAIQYAGDRNNEVAALVNLSDGWRQLGALQRARTDLDAALHLARGIGDRLYEAGVLITLSSVVLWQGEVALAVDCAQQALHITTAAQWQSFAAISALRLGAAELARGDTTAARVAHSQARALALEIDNPYAYDACASLAQTALAECSPELALQELKPVLDRFAAGDAMSGVEAPRLVEWTCHQVLASVGQAAAAAWLRQAHRALMAQADAIPDAALRHGFLTQIPHHREIVAAWARHERQ